jgi:ATP-dependent DNA helicase RecQ
VPDWLSEQAAAPKLPDQKTAAVKPKAARSAAPSAVFEGNSELREYLRMWRRDTAQRQGIPAFTVMHDTSLDELCRVMPQSLAEIRQIYGLGERKTESYGREILAAIGHFRQGARAPRASIEKMPPAREQTVQLIMQGKTLGEIAGRRGRQLSSVVELVASMVESGEVAFCSSWVDAGKCAEIEKACAQHGTDRLRTLKDALPPEITFEDIKLVVARVRHELAKTEGEANRQGFP